jgi:hypothetical protein
VRKVHCWRPKHLLRQRLRARRQAKRVVGTVAKQRSSGCSSEGAARWRRLLLVLLLPSTAAAGLRFVVPPVGLRVGGA